MTPGLSKLTLCELSFNTIYRYRKLKMMVNRDMALHAGHSFLQTAGALHLWMKLAKSEGYPHCVWVGLVNKFVIGSYNVTVPMKHPSHQIIIKKCVLKSIWPLFCQYHCAVCKLCSEAHYIESVWYLVPFTCLQHKTSSGVLLIYSTNVQFRLKRIK